MVDPRDGLSERTIEPQEAKMTTEAQRHREEELVGLRDSLSERVIGLAIEVHRGLGPGLLESAYEECLCCELKSAGLSFARQVALPVVYKSVKLECGYRMDLVVDQRLVVEIKAVERLLPVHEAQLLTYLKLSSMPTGLLLNFHVAVLKDGIKRLVL